MVGNPFCCVCGKAGAFPENLCPDCRVKDLLLNEPQLEKLVPRCKSCKRIFLRGGWRAVPEDKVPRFRNAKCPDCHKKDSHHYTTILQLSGLTPKRKEAIESLIKRILSEENSRGKVTALTRTKPDKNEYYFTHVSTVRMIVRRLAKAEPIQVREDSSLIGYDHAAGHGNYKRSVLVKFLKDE
jgi:NMD protein affecting ribosome stability and mRNA decay